MNKLIIFDLDGVLIESRDLHYHALNRALLDIDTKFEIPYQEHLAKYDGLPTTRKLKLLTEEKGLDPKHYDFIWRMKQSYTIDLIHLTPFTPKNREIFRECKKRGYKIAVASNSIRDTLKAVLLSQKLMEDCDYYVSNEDVSRAKPYPEMYWQCMTKLNALPQDTIIVEDSHIGRTGAINSGARLLAVENTNDLTLEKVIDAMQTQKSGQKSVRWIDSKLNVLIPMAGAGSRFAQVGYTFPKPLIEVNGKPMIQHVVENLNIDARFIFLVQKDHYDRYNLKYMLNLIAPNNEIIIIDGLTEGAACTTLYARDLINTDNPLLIANSDQHVEWNSNEVMYAFQNDNIDGGILTFKSTHPKWSYAKTDAHGFVSEVAEKKVISDNATVGIYYWKHGSDYVRYADQMIAKNIRVNNEFYVAPVFNEAIADGKKIRMKEVREMYGLGTPEDLDMFMRRSK